MADSNQIDEALADWAKRIPVDHIPGILVFLASRLLTKRDVTSSVQRANDHAPELLLTAADLANHLCVPESWVRKEERAGRIPSVRLGKYVRFRRAEVERALVQNAEPGR